MLLSVSNIAWPAASDSEAYTLLRNGGVTGLEVAPTRFWPGWEGASRTAARTLGRRLADEGLSVPALQAVTYGLPELQLFGPPSSRTALVDHLERVADLATELGARVLVFGAPKNRARGGLEPRRAFASATETFREIGRSFASRGLVLGLEPNPPEYGCDFVNLSSEALALVEAVDSPGFGLHLDAAALHLVGEDPSEALPPVASALRHFHASEPFLGSFAEPEVDHQRLSAALERIGYDGWISIEMRPGEEPMESLAHAVRYVSRTYLSRNADGGQTAPDHV
jgi:D-psicose/D-tagatose/L-ribulose 3-epimerase